ncbi:MAG: hypothetical protein K2X91_05795 [Thermoleophilia bacterium]|nr:hypothetical protein [Thermoleophilia bacterium]
MDFRFYVGVHHPRLVWPLTLRGFRVCLSANVLRGRTCDIPFLGCDEPWLLDSGAFTQVALQGGFSQSPKAYAAMIRRYATTGLIAASTQDYTGRVHLLPVLQGRKPDDYRRHLEAYGDRIGRGAWVGVGSLCKRQGDPAVIAAILDAILLDRPDLRLHGFGCKRTSLFDPEVRRRLASADSMAWSYAARFEGRDQNAWHEAGRFALGVGGCPEAVDRLAAAAGWRRAVERPAAASERGMGAALWLQ